MSKARTTEPEEKHVKFSTDVAYFDKYLQALAATRDEGVLIFTDDRIYSKVVDPANVMMCVSKLEGQSLNSLNIQNTDKLEAGIKFERLRECLKGVSSNSEIEITYPVSSGGSRLIKLDVIDEDLQFEVTTLDTDAVPPIPEADPLSHPTRVVVGGGDLKQSVKHAGKLEDKETGSVVFRTTEGMFEISTSDKVDGNFKKQFHQSGPSEGGELDEHQTEVALQYLVDINKVFGRGNEMTVHIKDEHPIRFDVELDDVGDGKVLYIIAPRLESN